MEIEDPMARQKKHETKLKEGRCQYNGAEYVPYYLAQEAKSIGTATRIPDAKAKRDYHTLSTVERDFLNILRWDDDVDEIKEQYLLDQDKVRLIARQIGIKHIGRGYTTDFYVSYRDGTKHAYSCKWHSREFDKDNYSGADNQSQYYKTMMRQYLELLYWRCEGVSLSIVTSDDINTILANNIRFVLAFYNEISIVNTQQKLLYLIAHKYIRLPLDKEPIIPAKLVAMANFDIDELYRRIMEIKIAGGLVDAKTVRTWIDNLER